MRKPLKLAALCLSVTPACTNSPTADHPRADTAGSLHSHGPVTTDGKDDGKKVCDGEDEHDGKNHPDGKDGHDGDAEQDGEVTCGGGITPGPVPPALQDRIDELDHCQSRLQDTHATFPAQDIQGEEGPAFLYVFYNTDESNLTNIFTTHVPGQNDMCELPANEAIGTIRGVLEAKPGAIVDPADPRSLVDLFTDNCGLIVINNESGWYEGWLMHDVRVPDIGKPDEKGHPPFGLITEEDAKILKSLGTGQDVPGNILTTDGRAPDPFGLDMSPKSPGNNVVTVPVTLGAWNVLQGEDSHSYWELNEYTNFTFPLYETPTTGGFLDTYARGWQYGPLGGIGPNADSRIPGSGPSGILNNNTVGGKTTWGDDPALPRDADRTPEVCDEDEDEAEQRLRFIPSGLGQEILLDVYARLASFEPAVLDPIQRYFDAYAYEVGLLDENHDGVLQFEEVDIEDESNGLPNTRLYLAPNAFNRVLITREINDGLLAPRYAPQQQKAAVLQGEGTFVPLPD